MTKELPKTYNPKEVEDKIYKLWEESGFFNPDNLPLQQVQGKPVPRTKIRSRHRSAQHHW